MHTLRLHLCALACAVVSGCAPAPQCDGLDVGVGADATRCIQPGSGEQFEDCPDCPRMVVVPAGEFTMGSPEDEPERESARESQVDVRIARPFAIGAFTVTRAQFAAFVSATGYEVDRGCYFWTGSTWEERADRSWRAPGFEQDDAHPVTCIDLESAQAYAKWLSTTTGKRYRLPSETEREYVTRAGTDTAFWWGDSITTDRANYNGENSSVLGAPGVWRQATLRVDSFEPNAWGLYNVHGNVWEWTEDCWNDSNEGNPGDGSARTTGDCTWRVARGGAWNYSPTYLRSAYRYWNLPDNRSGVQGMRVVRDLP